jgi:hypothetical protein
MLAFVSTTGIRTFLFVVGAVDVMEGDTKANVHVYMQRNN